MSKWRTVVKSMKGGEEYRVQVRCAKVAEPKYEDLMSKVRTCSACHQNAPEGDMRTADGAWMCPSCYGVWWAVRQEGANQASKIG
jgi:formylmethanofuran dehydrogenase subunit E